MTRETDAGINRQRRGRRKRRGKKKAREKAKKDEERGGETSVSCIMEGLYDPPFSLVPRSFAKGLDSPMVFFPHLGTTWLCWPPPTVAIREERVYKSPSSFSWLLHE